VNYKSIKLPSEAPFPIEMIKHDNSIKAVVINGLRIEGDYGLKVMIEQPFEEVSRHRVTATIEGFGSKVLYFDSRYEGEDEVAALEAAGAKIVREDVKALIDASGAIVGDAGKPASAITSSDLPF
jgi:hypothetical protein